MYKLSDLKVGMTVHISDLDSIVGVPIVLDKRTMDYSTGDPSGKIIYIGAGYSKVVDTKNIVVITNHYDATKGYYDGSLIDND